MSGIFGIFNRNGNDVDKQIVESMLDAMSSWGPDEKGVFIDCQVALGHTMLWNTPESKYDNLPLKNDTFVLTMNARIDNRDILAKELVLPERPLCEIGDSEFILAAYKKWGEECPKHLLGDFVFVIWDSEKEQLFCARDQIGIKNIHYYLSNDLFVFSNDIKGILSHKNVSQKYDNKTIALFLKNQELKINRSTFFEKIKKLPAASTLIITSENVIEKKYWKIEDSPKITYSKNEEYIDRLKELFDKSIEARLRTSYRVVSHLSGGIDSSPIAVLAARKLKKKDQPLYAYNWINIPKKDDDYELQSWDFSRRIAENENILHKEITIGPEDIANLYDQFDVTSKGTIFYWREFFIQGKANIMSARTILSGWGGDDLISNNGYGYESGLFWKGKIIQALKYLYDEKKQREYSWLKFIKRCGREILYPIFYKWLDFGIQKREEYPYVQKEFMKVMKKHKYKNLKFANGIKNKQFALFNNGHILSRIESWEMSSFSRKLEYSYPLLDKRIVEFAIGIPEDLFAVKNNHRRFLWRKTIEELLPYDIAWFPKYREIRVARTEKLFYRETLRIWYDKHKNDTTISSNKYVDFDKIIKMLKNFNFKEGDVYKLKNIIASILILKCK